MEDLFKIYHTMNHVDRDQYRDLLKLHPSLQEYFDWMQWSDDKRHELAAAKDKAEREFALLQRKVEELTSELEKERSEMDQLHKDNAAYRYMKEK